MRNNNILQYTFLFLFIAFLSTASHAQTKSRKQLEDRKGASLKKIEETNKILSQTREQKESSLTKLNLINQKIKVQESLIQTINEEIELYDHEIRESEHIIVALTHDIQEMKAEYARMVVIAYRYSGSFDKIAYIFGADNFRQMALRYQYFKQYSATRTNQVLQIEAVTKTLERQRANLLKRRNAKAVLAGVKTREANNLNQTKVQHDEVIKELSAKEIQLREDLEKEQKERDKLEKLIVDLIEEERRKAIAAEKKAAALAAAAAKKESKKNSSGNSKSTASKPLKDTNANVALSSNFSNNMGKLPWPVSKGRISQRFGRQAHPVLKGVYVENLGVDIVTVTGEPIKAVFAGKVLTVAQVPGMNYVVMIQHGEFFTVYAKLKSVTVTTGQQVQRNDVLGQVYTDKSNNSEVQFQIWRNEQKLDPETWLHDK